MTPQELELPSDTRYRVVFADDIRKTDDAGKRRRIPEPMTCSTPAMALRMATRFGDPIRLVVQRRGGAVDLTYDLRPAALPLPLADYAGGDWPTLIAAIRVHRLQRRASS